MASVALPRASSLDALRVLVRASERLAARPGLTALVFFAIVAVALAHRSMGYPLFYDDLHLIRTFTPAELLGAVTGNWDPDGIESPGYRPLSILFNHTRAALFGDAPMPHHLFVLLLYAAFLAATARVGMALGMTLPQVLLAGLLTLVHKNNWWHLAWLTDGNRVFGGLLFAVAAWLAVRSAADRRPRWLVGALGFGTACLLVREEFLPAAITVPAIAFAFARLRRAECPGGMARAAAVGVGMLAMLAAFLLVRWLLVPASFFPPDHFPDGWWPMFQAVAQPIGVLPAGDPRFIAWMCVLAAQLGALVVVPAPSRLRALLWLGCALLSCTPAIQVLRINLGLFGITFMSLCHAELLGAVALRHRLGLLYASAVVAFVLAAAVPRVLTAEDALHPASLDRIVADADIALRPERPPVGIPPARLAAIRDELARAGFDQPGNYVPKLRRVNEELIREGRRTPDGDRLFSPLIHWMEN